MFAWPELHTRTAVIRESCVSIADTLLAKTLRTRMAVPPKGRPQKNTRHQSIFHGRRMKLHKIIWDITQTVTICMWQPGFLQENEIVIIHYTPKVANYVTRKTMTVKRAELQLQQMRFCQVYLHKQQLSFWRHGDRLNLYMVCSQLLLFASSSDHDSRWFFGNRLRQLHSQENNDGRFSLGLLFTLQQLPKYCY